MERLLFPLRANRREITNGESLGRLLSPALGDDLPRRIDDNTAIVTAARNSPQRYLQCGNLVGIEGPLGILVMPPSAKVSQV